jgi:Mu-like prophage FluMu N-terminal domain
MATNDKKPGGPTGKGLKVVPKRDGFRRAGHVFSGEGKTIAYADLTVGQVELLKGEPMLVVMEVDLPKEEPAKQEPAKDTKK